METIALKFSANVIKQFNKCKVMIWLIIIINSACLTSYIQQLTSVRIQNPTEMAKHLKVNLSLKKGCLLD